MKKMISFLGAVVMALFMASGTSADSSSGANSTANADAVVVQDDHSSTIVNENQKRPLVNAYPGPGAFIMTPMGAQKGTWNLYWSPLDSSFSLESIDMMRKKYTLPEIILFKWMKRHVRFTPRQKPLSQNSDPIVLLNWNPFKDGVHPGDKKIGEVVLKGDYSWKPWPFDALLGLALAEAKEKTQTKRVFVFVRMKDKAVADGISIGTGGGIAKAMGPAGIAVDNISGALAIGGLIGYTSLEMEDIEEITVMCMNDGPVEAPKKPVIEQKPEPKPEAKAPTKQEVEVKVVIETSKEPLRLSMEGPRESLKVQMETKAEPAPLPAVPLAPKEEKCDLPEITIYFDFDKSEIKTQEAPRVAMIAHWLKANPQCKVQIEGHACKIGGDDYNASLGRRRAKAVYDLLIGKGISSSQVSQFVSVSEDKPADFERLEKNRRVIVRIIGPASGK